MAASLRRDPIAAERARDTALTRHRAEHTEQAPPDPFRHESADDRNSIWLTPPCDQERVTQGLVLMNHRLIAHLDAILARQSRQLHTGPLTLAQAMVVLQAEYPQLHRIMTAAADGDTNRRIALREEIGHATLERRKAQAKAILAILMRPPQIRSPSHTSG